MSKRIALVGSKAQEVDAALQGSGYAVLRCDADELGSLDATTADLWLVDSAQAARGLGVRSSSMTPAAGAAIPDAQVAVIAEDARSRELFGLARRVAATGVSVLLSGESGAGKEVLARYIHRNSPRADGPFCAINCAAIPDTMLEAELFGHDKGAFTGATTSRPGKFEQADGGTLLLDEVTEMPVLLQAKLLRVLQEKEVERLGGRRTRRIDVRVIATTNRDTKAEVVAGRLREDLYYRLNVFPLHAPSLRERRADIPALVRYVIAKYVATERSVGVAPAALQALCDYDWPGNVRELENVVQRALVLVDDGVIETEHLVFGDGDGSTGSSTGANLALRHSLRSTEHAVIARALKEHGGNRAKTAGALGISERTLRHKLQKLREQGVDLVVGMGASS